MTDVVERFEGIESIMGKIVGGVESDANKWNFIVRLDGVAAGGTILRRVFKVMLSGWPSQPINMRYSRGQPIG